MSSANPAKIIQRFIRTFLPANDPAQALRHIFVGGTGTMLNWLTFSVLRHYTPLSTLACTAIVHVVVLSYVFPLQKVFTFRDPSHPHGPLLRYFLNHTAYMTLDFLLATLFIDILGLNAFIGKGIGLAILTPASFLSQRYWVFRGALLASKQRQEQSG